MIASTNLWRALTLGTVLILSFAPASLAQATAGSAAQEIAPTLGELRDRIENRYQVLPIQNGVVLMPRYRTDVQSIELANGSIGINGEPVTGAELTERIGDDAEDMRRLSFMDSTTRRVLFGIGPPPPVAEETEAAVTADAETEAAAEDEEDSVLGEDDGSTFVNQQGGDEVAVGNSLRVEADEHVRGDAVAVFGSARIDGKVDGDVVAVFGSVHLGPESVVNGEVVSVFGAVHREPGSVVRGGIEDVSLGHELQFRPEFGFSPIMPEIGGLIGTVLWIAFLAFIVSLAFLLARGPIERMEYRMTTSAWKAAAAGLVAWILFVPVLVMTCVILAISIIGIPLLILVPFALLALAIGILLGFVARVGSHQPVPVDSGWRRLSHRADALWRRARVDRRAVWGLWCDPDRHRAGDPVCRLDDRFWAVPADPLRDPLQLGQRGNPRAPRSGAGIRFERLRPDRIARRNLPLLGWYISPEEGFFNADTYIAPDRMPGLAGDGLAGGDIHGSDPGQGPPFAVVPGNPVLGRGWGAEGHQDPAPQGSLAGGRGCHPIAGAASHRRGPTVGRRDDPPRP